MSDLPSDSDISGVMSTFSALRSGLPSEADEAIRGALFGGQRRELIWLYRSLMAFWIAASNCGETSPVTASP